MISAEVLADSVGPSGDRVTTMVVTMHRFVLAEFNTHRVFSRNSASSRAIPVAKQLDRALHSPAFPLRLPCEKPGMSGGDELTGRDLRDAERLLENIWANTLNQITEYIRLHPDAEHRLHKSILNRPMEWFMWHTVVVTSTEWDNFFALRCHPAAQPEIRAAAELMRDAYRASKPIELANGEWHAPFTEDLQSGIMPVGLSLDVSQLEYQLKASAARCAWVSTMKHGEEASWADVQNIYRILTAGLENNEPVHASPFEHQCTPHRVTRGIGRGHQGNLRGWDQLRHMIELGREPWNDE